MFFYIRVLIAADGIVAPAAVHTGGRPHQPCVEQLYGRIVHPVYLEIPVLIAARFIISDFGRLIFNAGPYAAIGIAGKGKYTDEWEGTSMKFDLFSGDEAVLKRFDAGVQAGFAYEIKHIGFSYTFGYGLLKPFKEWNKEWGATPHNISHNFGLKYIF